MDRLAKKCVITSGIVHGTLVLLLIVGPAFLSSDNTPTSSQILTIIPDLASADGAAVMGFGTPNGGRQNPTPPAPTPPEPKPPTPAPPEPKPPVVERVKDTPKEKPEKPLEKDIKDAKPPEPTKQKDPDALEPAKPTKPVISLKPVIRKPNSNKDPEKAAAEERAERARAAADKERRLAAVHSAATSISSGASSGVEVGPIGVSTGSGPSVAAFGDILRTIYFNNWHEPSDATSDDGVVKVTVTIARDGTVISARITKSSGDPAVDRSVQRTLDNVSFIKPFPEGWKEAQRQFQLSFSLKAKRSIG